MAEETKNKGRKEKRGVIIRSPQPRTVTRVTGATPRTVTKNTGSTPRTVTAKRGPSNPSVKTVTNPSSNMGQAAGVGMGLYAQDLANRQAAAAAATAAPTSVQDPSMLQRMQALGQALGYGQGTNPYEGLTQGLMQRNQAIINQLAQSPDFSPLRAYVDDDLTRQQQAAGGAITQAYDQGAQSARDAAVAAAAAGEQAAAQQAAMYNEAAGNLSGATQSAANLATADYGMLGPAMSAVSGGAADIYADLVASAPRQAALAQNLGNISSNAQNEYATSMGGQKVAEMGTLGRTISNLKGQAISRINDQDIAMQQSARQAAMQAAMDFENQQMELELARRSYDDEKQRELRDFVTSGFLTETERQGGLSRALGIAQPNSGAIVALPREAQLAVDALNKSGQRPQAQQIQQLYNVAAMSGMTEQEIAASLATEMSTVMDALDQYNKANQAGFQLDPMWWAQDAYQSAAASRGTGTPTRWF